MTTTTPATLPTYDRFIEPLLRFLAGRPEGAPAREAHEAAADALGLDAAARQQLLSSGAQLIYKNRAGWAHDRLKRAGLSDSPRRGWWQLTEAGRRFVAEHAELLIHDEVSTPAVVSRLIKSAIKNSMLENLQVLDLQGKTSDSCHVDSCWFNN